jgi:hypothetical protein
LLLLLLLLLHPAERKFVDSGRLLGPHIFPDYHVPRIIHQASEPTTTHCALASRSR